MQTLLHYSVMVRDVYKDKERADQLLSQAMGEWHHYTTPGMLEPARQDELHRKPKVCQLETSLRVCLLLLFICMKA